jgi:hypothetical protein
MTAEHALDDAGVGELTAELLLGDVEGPRYVYLRVMMGKLRYRCVSMGRFHRPGTRGNDKT